MKFEISQVDRLTSTLRRLEDTYSTYRGSGAAQTQVRSALKIISDDAKGRVHSITGHLVGGIRVYARVRPDKEILGEVGVSYAKTKAHHAHLVEYGHDVVPRGKTRKITHPIDAEIKKVEMEKLTAKAARLNKKTGLKRPRNKGEPLTSVPPYPFWEPAVEAKRDTVLLHAEKAISDLLGSVFRQ